MSIEKVTRKGKDVWRVRWRDNAGQAHSKVLGRKHDAIAFDAEVKRSKRLGTLAAFEGGKQPLDEFAQEWAKLHAAHLSRKTRALYLYLLETHILPRLGGYPLRDLTSEVIGHWYADLRAAKVGPVAADKALTLLGGILQRAAEAGRIPTNPARLVRRAPRPRRSEVRPLAPITVERMSAASAERDGMLIAVLAYAGLRPGEALALRWSDVRDRTLLVERAISLGEEKDTKTTAHRTVRLLGPLAADLREWRLRSGRPADDRLIFPSREGRPWSQSAYQSWRRKAFRRALIAAGVEHARPYDLRHGFASLLLHEGRSVIYVARQLGHGAELTLRTYGHTIDELEDAPQQDAEAAIRTARESVVSGKCPPIELAAADD